MTDTLKITREASFSVIHFISNLRDTVLPQHAALFPLGLSCHSGLNTSFFKKITAGYRHARRFLYYNDKNGNPGMPQLISIPSCITVLYWHSREEAGGNSRLFWKHGPSVRTVWCAPKESRYDYTVTHSVHTWDTLMLSIWASFELAPSSANKYSDTFLLKPSQFQYFLFIYLYVNSGIFSWWYPTVLCIGTLFHKTHEWNSTCFPPPTQKKESGTAN